jgi:hypothetical protein
MPRPVSTAFANAVAAGTVRPAMLVECLFDSGPLRIWTGIGPLDWNGQTWTGAGGVIAIADVEEGASVQALGTSITLSGIDSSAVAIALAEPYQGRRIVLRMALFDDAGAIIASPDIVFDGRADVMTIVDSGATCTIAMTAESMFIDLQRSRERRYEHEDQQLDYPGDLGFAFVSQIQDQPLKWGQT